MSILKNLNTGANGFKPQFLYTDESWIKQRISEGKALELIINETLEEVQKLFSEKLTGSESISILKDGMLSVSNLMRVKLGFPNAKDEVLYGLIGKNPINARIILSKFKGRYRLDEYIFQDGKFFLSNSAVDGFRKIATYYTKSEKGNISLRIANNICNELNNALKLGLIFNPSMGEQTPITKYFDLVKEKIISNNNEKGRLHKIEIEYYPNFYKIRLL